MLEITYKIDGKTVKLNNLADAMQASILKMVSEKNQG